MGGFGRSNEVGFGRRQGVVRVRRELRRVDGIGGSGGDGLEGGKEEVEEGVGLREGGGSPENEGGGMGSVEGSEAGWKQGRDEDMC